jgi:hypothetical protein
VEYRTDRTTHATEIYLGPESEGLEALINRGNTTFVVDAPAPTHCGWCRTPVVSVHFPTRGWINADVFTDADGVTRADVLHEHRCEPMEEFARRLETPDPWEGWESE